MKLYCAFLCAALAARACAASNVDRLFDLCLADADCRRLYHLDVGLPSRASFRHLLPTSAIDAAWESPLQGIVGASVPTERAWLLEISAHRRGQDALCDVNHRYVYDDVSQRSACVCLPDRVCHDHLYPLTPYWVALGLFAVASVLFFIGMAFTATAVVRRLEKVSRHGGDGYRALHAAVS
jgi:hypothetical protein